jgi:hypothetical protein
MNEEKELKRLLNLCIQSRNKAIAAVNEASSAQKRMYDVETDHKKNLTALADVWPKGKVIVFEGLVWNLGFGNGDIHVIEAETLTSDTTCNCGPNEACSNCPERKTEYNPAKHNYF